MQAEMTPRSLRLRLLGLLPRAWVRMHGRRDEPALYLSFDDGPHPSHTPPLLALLAAHGVRATFFLIGDQLEANAALVAQLVAQGHVLGNHSFSHPRFETLPFAAQCGEIARTDELLAVHDGRSTHAFRPPRGVLPLRLLLHFVRHRRCFAFWSYDSLDSRGRAVDELLELIRRDPPRPGDILLFHDDGGVSRQLLATLLPEWKAQGFVFRTIDPE